MLLHIDGLSHLQVTELSPHLLLFGVYDGHGGSAASDFACTHMENHIRAVMERGETNLGTILKQAFVNLNTDFSRYLRYSLPGTYRTIEACYT